MEKNWWIVRMKGGNDDVVMMGLKKLSGQGGIEA